MENTKFQKLLTTLKRPKYYIFIILALVVIFILYLTVFKKDDNSSLVTVVAERTTISQEVTATGNVEPADSVDLAFQIGGKIAKINVKVGEHAKKGQTLVSLENIIESATLTQETAKLEQLIEGTRIEDLAVSNASVMSAKADLTSAEAALVVSLNDAFSKTDDAVRNHVDKIFKNPETSPNFGGVYTSGGINYIVSVSDFKTASILNDGRWSVQKILTAWPVVTSSDDILLLAEESLLNMRSIQTFLNNVSSAINSFNSTENATSDIYSSLKTEIATARLSVDTAISNLNTAIQTYKSKQSAFNLANSQYLLKNAPATTYNLQIQEASVAQARASLAKTIIKAPFDGVITKVLGTEGEIASINTPVVSVITDSNLEIEVNIPEADIPKVKLGAKASITFDAYGKDFVAYASVVSIDPAATILEGVPTYQTTLHFDNMDEKIKSGMTANITIVGEKKDNVLAVSQRAVTTDGDEKSVQVMIGKNTEKRNVTTGLRGSKGEIEITSGLNEGDVVVTSNLAK